MTSGRLMVTLCPKVSSLKIRSSASTVCAGVLQGRRTGNRRLFLRSAIERRDGLTAMSNKIAAQRLDSLADEVLRARLGGHQPQPFD